MYKVVCNLDALVLIAMKRFILVSSYRTAVDNAVLKLAESGKLVELKNRWWKAADSVECVVS